jgi:4'-phosphopantetheinyl transferase
MHAPAVASADPGPLRWHPAAAEPPALGDTTHLHWTPVPHDAAPQSRRGRLDRLLRAVLAPYVGLAPTALVFGRESRGRPFLRHAGAPDFNLSDTVGGTLVAVCGAGRIGVDLERIDRALPAVRIARRWFAPDEAAALAALPELGARLRFLQWWTAKEASCKATGTGIFGRLPQWRFADSAQPQAMALPGDAGDAARWQFARLVPAEGYTAVLAWRDAPEGVASLVQGFVREA